MKISILVPTRNRPENIKTLYESLYKKTKHKDNIEILFYIDKDDINSKQFFKKNRGRFLIENKVFIGSRTTLGKAYNYLYKQCEGDLVMSAADDIEFRTDGWDEVLLKEYYKIKDKIALFAVDDLYQDTAKLATHPILCREAIDIIGKFIPDDIDCNYGDEWYTYIYKAIDRYIVLPIIIEHNHWLVGKANRDKTYLEGSANMRRHSETAFHNSKSERDEIVKKLADHISNY
tara:strand:+ start:4164 stop:4859 length:696 start_codon:yes stop_codon:yes gene_type:complete